MIPFCRVIRPTKSTYGPRRVDPVARQRIGGGVGREEVSVDPVVDDADPLRLDREVAEHVVARPLADRDDGVGRLERGPLDPAREVVAAAELLALPRPERLERVDRDDQRDRRCAA